MHLGTGNKLERDPERPEAYDAEARRGVWGKKRFMGILRIKSKKKCPLNIEIAILAATRTPNPKNTEYNKHKERGVFVETHTFPVGEGLYFLEQRIQ